MIAVDTHLHIYDSYALEEAVRGCVRRLTEFAPIAGGILVERSGQHVYRALLDGSAVDLQGGMSVNELDSGRCLELCPRGGGSLYLFPGRQIVTGERLEILCLGIDADIPDGLPAETAVRRVLEVGGVPVLAWAVGKWLFKRSRVVSSLLNTFSPEKLLVGDSAMRPVFWAEPRLMRQARAQGFRVLAGTDPLPAAGEAAVMGRYASRLDIDFVPDGAGKLLKAAMLNSEISLQTVGSRSAPLEFLRRMRNA
jgi:hypothetical protein